ncbi:MAG: hypothetical protein ACTS3F_05440 [Phycisphaerales bacterium]
MDVPKLRPRCAPARGACGWGLFEPPQIIAEERDMLTGCALALDGTLHQVIDGASLSSNCSEHLSACLSRHADDSGERAASTSASSARRMGSGRSAQAFTGAARSGSVGLGMVAAP